MSNSIKHPGHYVKAINGVDKEVIYFTSRLPFCIGNVFKYIARAGVKSSASFGQDLLKAQQYLFFLVDTSGNIEPLEDKVEIKDIGELIKELGAETRIPNPKSRETVTKKDLLLLTLGIVDNNIPKPVRYMISAILYSYLTYFIAKGSYNQ